MRYRVDSSVDPGFRTAYERYMLETCGPDPLPNPHGARHGIFHNYRPWEYQKVFAHGDFCGDDVVLDTGAMHTYFCIYLSQFVRTVQATDNFYWATRQYMANQRLSSPEEWVAYLERKGRGKIRGEAADLTKLPYADDAFDKVLCVSTIEHVPDDAQGIRELARVLKPVGRLLLTTEFNRRVGKAYSEADNSYYRVYDQPALERLIGHSGLALRGDAVVEKRNYLFVRRHVNVFLCLTK
jgi:SAM-dependent methyltransferase